MLMAHQILFNLAEGQLTLCLRWIDECFSVYEDFLGFYEVLNIKSGTIISTIRYFLLRIQTSSEKCRGKCYDGVTDMLGKK